MSGHGAAIGCASVSMCNYCCSHINCATIDECLRLYRGISEIVKKVIYRLLGFGERHALAQSSPPHIWDCLLRTTGSKIGETDPRQLADIAVDLFYSRFENLPRRNFRNT